MIEKTAVKMKSLENQQKRLHQQENRKQHPYINLWVVFFVYGNVSNWFGQKVVVSFEWIDVIQNSSFSF